MLHFIILLILSSLSYSAPLSIQEEWRGISSPLLMGANFETRFNFLPQKASLSQSGKNWSGDYWANNKGSINRRWNTKSLTELAPQDPTEAQLWSLEKLKHLSPSEKFDLLNGRYWYPLREEVEKDSNYGASNWEGLCHGWAPASLNHIEPTEKILKNPQGILIPFGSSDIKAILSYFYANPYQVPDTHQMGRRCEEGVINTDDECKQDLNAGAFHIVMANRIGFENLGFVADLSRYKEVWNHPIVGYETRILKNMGILSNSASGTLRTVRVKSTIFYINESYNSWGPLIGTNGQITKQIEFKYDLDLDQEGKIIGGFWRSADRPDFLWIKEKPNSYPENYLRLQELLNDTI